MSRLGQKQILGIHFTCIGGKCNEGADVDVKHVQIMPEVECYLLLEMMNNMLS